MSSEQFGVRAIRGFAWNHLYRFVDYAIYFLFTAMVARALGANTVAPFFVYLSVAFPIALVGSVGVDGVLLRYITRIKKEGQPIDPYDLTTLPLVQFLTRLLSFRVVITLGLGLLVLLTLVALPSAIPSLHATFGSLPSLAPYLILFLFGQAAISFSTFALIGLLQVRRVFIASFISRLLLIGSAGALILTSTLTVESAVVIHAISVAVNAILLLYALWGAIEEGKAETVDPITRRQTPFAGVLKETANFIRKPSALKFFLLTPVMLYGVTTWGSDLLSTVLGRQPDIIMIRVFFGEHSKEISNYQIATTLLLMAEYIVVFGLSGTIVSVFSSLAHQDEQDENRDGKAYPRLLKARREVAQFLTVATLPICAFVFAFSKTLILFVFGKEFLPATPILQAGILFTASNVALTGGGIQITSLVTIGKERLVFRNRLVWGVVNLVANIFLIYEFGAIGALVGTQVSNIAACVVEFFYARRLVGSTFDWSNTWIVSSIASGSALLGYFLVSLTSASFPLTVQLTIGAIVTFGSTLLCYRFFKLRSAKRIFDKLRETFLPKPAEEVRPA